MDNQQLQIPAEIHTFLEGILQDAGMTTLDNEMREEMIKELFVRLDNFMTTAIMDNLPPDKLEEFTKMAEEKKTMAEMQEYLKTNIAGAEEVFTKALLEFRNLYLGNVAVARNAPKANEPAAN